MSYYLGLDLGTTVVKGIVIDEKGKIIAETSKVSRLFTEQPKFAEQSAEGWWSTTLEILQILRTQVDFKKIKGIGLSGQMHGLVVYDEKMKPLRKAIVWLDQRSQAEVEEILNKVGRQRLYRLTGNPVFTGFLLPSLLWLKKNRKELYQKISKVSSPKDYLAYKLTGSLSSEPTDALATAAFDYQREDWSRRILEAVKIKGDIFPKIKDTDEPYGGLRKNLSQVLGIPEGTLVYGGSDQAMAAVGSGLLAKGDAMIALSTGGQFLVVDKKGKIDPKRRLHTLNHALKDKGLYMAATLAAGFSLKWFKNNILEDDRSYPELTEGVEKIPLGSQGLLYHPYLAGERTPYFNADLRGSFIGLSLAHTRMDLMHAIMEGVALAMQDAFEVFKQNKIKPKRIILSGGGAKNPVWRQILADVMGVPLQTINFEDHSPYGAALYARFCQEGLDKLPAFSRKIIKTVDFIYPNEMAHKEYQKIFLEYKKIGEYMHRRAREKKLGRKD